MALKDWSATPASNTGIIDGMSLDGSVMTVNQTDNAFRDIAAQIYAQVGKVGAQSSNIASASTTNLANATGWYVTVSGTTTITSFGTVAVGQVFLLVFTGALTLTHNASSLVLPGLANITTSAGDSMIMLSLGSGNWRCINYNRSAGGIVGDLTLVDTAFTLTGSSDFTKKVQFQADNLTTATTRTMTLPDADTTLVGTGVTQTLTNKTINITDSSLSLLGSADATKIVQFQVDGLTTGTTRTITIPDATDTMVTLDATQTLTNKSIVATQLTGTVASARMSGSYTGITGTGALGAGSITSGFGNINNGSSTLTTGAATVASLTSSGAVSGTTGSFSGDIVANGNTLIGAAGVPTATAGLALGALGTYALLRRTSGVATSPGDVLSGSALVYTSAGGDNSGSSPSGTWRCMGFTSTSGISSNSSLFLRIT